MAKAIKALVFVLLLSAVAAAFETRSVGMGPLRTNEPPEQDFIDAYDEAYADYVVMKAYYEGQGYVVTYNGNAAWTEYLTMSNMYAHVEIYYYVSE